MYLTYPCPRCEQTNRSGDVTVEPALSCVHCGWHRALDRELVKSGVPQECLRCGNADLWRQKNFPQWLGLSFVAAGAISSSVAWAYHRPVLALGILMGFALLDMVLYLTMSDVLVCYRCRTRHHDADVSQHESFNHELAERYRQERLRLEQSSSAGGSAGNPSPPVSS